MPALRLHPEMFGTPNSRARTWRICFSNKKKWDADFSLEEFAKLLLHDGSNLMLDYQCYLVATPGDLIGKPVYETDLTQCQPHYQSDLLLLKMRIQPSMFYLVSLPLRCQLRHLTAFRNEMPHRELYDLSANVKKRRRTEKADRGLPCLTTSSQLWFLAQT